MGPNLALRFFQAKVITSKYRARSIVYLMGSGCIKIDRKWCLCAIRSEISKKGKREKGKEVKGSERGKRERSKIWCDPSAIEREKIMEMYKTGTTLNIFSGILFVQ